MNRQDFLKPRKRTITKVDFHGEQLHIAALGAKDLSRIQSISKDRNHIEFVYDLIACCLVDENNERIFSNWEDCQNSLDWGFDEVIELGEECSKASGGLIAKKKANEN